MRNPENIIKGRIAETIVSEMLRDSGYYVYRFGYEGILQSLIQRGLPRMLESDREAEIIRIMPDFIVMTKEGDVSFVEVKFRASNNLERETEQMILKTAKHWPDARMLFVKPKKPHFLIARAKDFAKKHTLYPLEIERFLKVSQESIQKYEKLVEKYLGINSA